MEGKKKSNAHKKRKEMGEKACPRHNSAHFNAATVLPGNETWCENSTSEAKVDIFKVAQRMHQAQVSHYMA